jgi:hypothetical protein
MEAPLCFYLGNAQYFKKKLVMGQINVVPYIFLNATPNYLIKATIDTQEYP